MSTREQLFQLLYENRGSFLSGEILGESLGISRSAVWKGIRGLKEDGYPIEAVTNKGYRLLGDKDYLSQDEIRRWLIPQALPLEIRLFDTLDSTNREAKRVAMTEDPQTPVVFISDHQTGGRGRLGRSFYSPQGKGLYMSLLFRPELDLSQGVLVTIGASVAVLLAIEKLMPVSLDIKWVNDLYLQGKKICGILTEAVSDFETGKVSSLVMGIGVNCYDVEFPGELKAKAGFLATEVSRSRLAAEILNQWALLAPELEHGGFLPLYRERSMVLGREILVHPGGPDAPGTKAKALSVDSAGGLVVRYLEGPKKNQEETLSGGEISIRVFQ